MSDTVQQEPATPEYVVKESLFARARLARLVVVGSFLTLFLLVGTLVVLSQQNAKGDVSPAATNAFNAILPVLAGWVGTVLAFYFSAASQERTSASLDKSIDKSGATGGDGTPVATKMIPLASIRKLTDLAKDPPEKIPLTDLQKAFDPKTEGAVTRMLFTENGVFRYLVHVSEFNAFLQKQANPPAKPANAADAQQPAAEPPPPARTVDQLTLHDMLVDQDTLHTISKLVVFVSASATLGEAQTALASVKGAQDIIVTATGNASAPILGWLSNVDLTKALTAN